MDVSNALTTASTEFLKAGIDEPRREAVSLLCFILKKPSSFLVAHPEYVLNDIELATFTSFIARRAAREPFQYLTGKQEFWGLDFIVTPDVLIPRPETEILVEAAIEILTILKDPRFCEIGVGSGCISVSILHSVPEATAVGIDISPPAIKLARTNAENHGVASRLSLVGGDVFNAVGERFDLIVSNPPYIPDDEMDSLQAEVLGFEPHLALRGGPGGLKIVQRIIAKASHYLKPRGSLLIEIGMSQWPRVEAMFDREMWVTVEHLPDHRQIPRIVRARLRS